MVKDSNRQVFQLKVLVFALFFFLVGCGGNKKQPTGELIGALKIPAPGLSQQSVPVKPQTETDQKKLESNPLAQLSTGDKEKLATILFGTAPFLESAPDVKSAPTSLHHLFTDRIYRKLRGNIFWGYLCDEGFHFSGKTIAIDIFKGAPEAMEYVQTVKRYFYLAAGQMKISIDPNARFHVGICVVGVQPVFSRRPYTCPGLVSEFYFADHQTRRGFFMRSGFGKKESLEKAFELYGAYVLQLLLNTANT